jgi:hypothetical protein
MLVDKQNSQSVTERQTYHRQIPVELIYRSIIVKLIALQEPQHMELIIVSLWSMLILIYGETSYKL